VHEAVPWSDQQLAAMRSILTTWHCLSRGDILIVTQCVREPAAVALTVRGSAHARLWQEFVRIGWADYLYSPIDPYEHDPEPLAFRLTPGGERPLSHFLVYYDLLNMGACTPAIDRGSRMAAYLDTSKFAKEKPRAQGRQRSAVSIDVRFVLRLWSLLASLLVPKQQQSERCPATKT
jgi:hypothetical protein